MPGLTVPLGLDGAQVPVTVETDARFSKSRAPAVALLDTGASMTAISPTLLRRINAPVIGTVDIARASESASTRATSLVSIRIGAEDGSTHPYLLEAVAAQPVTPGVDVLIGMDLLLRIRVLFDGVRRKAVLDFAPA